MTDPKPRRTRKPAAKKPTAAAPVTEVVDLPLAGQSSLAVELEIKLANGISFPVRMDLRYPENMGFHAVQAGAQMFGEDKREQLWQELLNRGDLSMAQAVKDAGGDPEPEPAE